LLRFAGSGTAEAIDQAVLVRRVQDGDADAFEHLYRHNVDRVYAVCLRMVADVSLAEELTQDVFVRAWEAIGTFRGESAFSTWLHRLAVNVVLGRMRSLKREDRWLLPEADGAEFGVQAAGAEPGLRLDLEAAIAKLPPGARQVFVLHDMEGYKHEEIARLTGTAVGTMKAQLHRARKLLRGMLQ
jgi:RNA polymerase sigma-70 factor, ECF subfamily